MTTIIVGIFFRSFLILGICVVGVSLTWVLTMRIRLIWLRILLRAFSFAVFFCPIIPHRTLEWGMPFPPAGYLVLTGLIDGQLVVFELLSILIATIVMWLAGIAVYDYRKRRIKSHKRIDRTI